MHMEIAAIARRQFGLVSLAQARELVTDRQIKHLVSSGRLELVRRGVYRTVGTPVIWHQHLLAATLAAPGSVASHTSGAAVWKLALPEPGSVEITVQRRRRVRLDGVVVHQTLVLPEAHTTRRHGIPVTTVARTLCDLTVHLTERALAAVVDDALRRRLVNLPHLRTVADELDGQGRGRCTIMRSILAARVQGFDPGGSAQEMRVAKLLVAAGLPAPVAQHRFRIGGRTYRVDLAYPEYGIVIEYDGWDHHGARGAFDGDRVRGNQLELLDLTVLRFTSAFTDAQIVADVRQALARAGYRAA